MATVTNLSDDRDEAVISICADGYGLAPGVSRAIRLLAVAGRISATSCMTVFTDWREEAARLRDLAGEVEVGLHLVLSDVEDRPTLPRLLAASHLGLLRRTAVAEEVYRQLDAFESEMGRPPAFVDGHRHVHALPVVRDVVAGLFEDRLDRARTWMRICTAPAADVRRWRVAVPKALLVDLLSRPLARLAAARGIRTNRAFRGVNAFDGSPVAPMYEKWLDDAEPGTLIMCHPGAVDDLLRARDPVHAPRADEFAYLSGEAFSAALAVRGLRVGPLP